MRNEKEIIELHRVINESGDELPTGDNLTTKTDEAYHWQDALEWVLKIEEKKK